MRGTPSDIIGRALPGRGLAPRPGVAGGAPWGAPGSGSGAAVVSIWPPDIVQFPGTFPLYLDGNAAPAAGVRTLLATTTLPPDQVGILRSVLMSAVNITTATVATFTLLVNNSPYVGWSRTIPLQNSAFAVVTYGPDETFIRLPAGAQVGLSVTLTGAGGLTVQMQAAGWFYPFTIRDRFAPAWEV